MLKKYKFYFLLLLIASSWLLFFSFVIQLKMNFLLEGDEPGYFQAAQKLYSSFRLDDGRPLLIAAINGFPLLFGLKIDWLNYWIFLINVFSWLATAFFIFDIVATNFNKKAGFFLALIYIFCVGNLAITFKVLSESVFIMFLIFGIFLTNKYLLSRNYKFLSVAISIFFLASLIKPIALGMGFILTFIFIKNLKLIFINKYSIFIFLSIGLVFFQMNTLKKEYGNFTISYIDGFTYYNYLGTRADCLKNNTKFIQGKNPRFLYLSKFNHVEQKKIVLSDFKNQLFNNTFYLIKAYFINILSNSTHGSPVITNCQNKNKTNYFDFFKVLFKVLSKIQNIIYTTIGLSLSLYCLKNYQSFNKLLFLISALQLYLFLLSAISSNQGDRLHLVLFPLTILLLMPFLLKFNNRFYS